MQRYIFVRVLQTVVALWAVTIIVFALARITGNPLDTLLSFEATADDRALVAKAWGLDRPLYVQYFTFVGNALRGQFGESFKWRMSAGELVVDRLPATLSLAGLSIAIATLVAVPVGVITAVKRDSFFDYGGKALALIGQAAPPFWVGLVLIWIFGVAFDLVPTSGRSGASSYILPAVSLGLFWVAALMRLIRSSMLDALDSEYVKLARVKGLPEWKVIWKHTLRNAAIAPITYFGIILGSLLVGSVSIETVFAWPGVGFLAFQSVLARDFPVIQTVVLFFSIIYIVTNLIIDILYAYLDPRIRYN
jgi:peptide/nickel transport system permease protein